MAKITTGELYNEWQQINNKLELLNNKVDGIIEGDAVNTRLTGSMLELKRINNLELSPNESVRIIDDEAIKKPLVLMTIRQAISSEYRAFPFEIEFRARDSANNALSKKVIEYGAEDFEENFTKFEMSSTNLRITIKNIGERDGLISYGQVVGRD